MMGEHDKGIDGLIEMFNKHNKLNDAFSEFYKPAEDTREQKLRDKYPTLQEAWEKYQAILKLVDTDETGLK